MDGAFDHAGGRRFGQRSLTVAVLLIALSSNLFAQEADEPQADEGELAELMEVIEQETEVATKTRMNSDFVPGIVTVLRGEELEALGVTTAGEALGLVPGMQALRDGSGNHSVIVRGLDFPFNSGNIQILINSIPLTRQDAGINSAALQIPVEQIERIEVIRGPGSVVYGDFAFMGLVNVITRDSGTRVFARGETPHPTLTAGARYAAPAGSTPQYSFDISRRGSDNAIAANTVEGADEETWFAIGRVASGGFSFNAQAADREYTPPTGTPFDEKSWVAEASYKHDFGSAIHSTASITHLDNEISATASQFYGSMSRLSIDVIADTFRNQSWLFAVDYSRSEIDEAYHRPAPPPNRPPNPFTLLVRDAEREIFGFTAQDRIDLTPGISVTLGARFDDYSDLDSRVTPRAAVVWRVSDQHIVKAQYAEGYRPPTFFEFFSPVAPGTTPRYPFEVNATTEVNYVFRMPGAVGRATIFRSDLEDLLRPGGVVLPRPAKAEGLELEWTQELGSKLRADANISFVDTVDPRVPGTDRPNLVSSEVLGNVSFLYRPLESMVVGGRWNHVGDRETVEGYDTVDLSVSQRNLFFRGLDLRAGVRNVLDDEVRFLAARPTGEVIQTQYSGRTSWVQVGWRFGE